MSDMFHEMCLYRFKGQSCAYCGLQCVFKDSSKSAEYLMNEKVSLEKELADANERLNKIAELIDKHSCEFWDDCSSCEYDCGIREAYDIAKRKS